MKWTLGVALCSWVEVLKHLCSGGIPLTTSATFKVDNHLFAHKIQNKHNVLSSHLIQPPIIVSGTESVTETPPLSARTRGRPFNQLAVDGASGADLRNTLSSCGTNSDTLMPWCHWQYVCTMMMFPHKYFMLWSASKTHSARAEEETCVLSLSNGSRPKVNEKKSFDAPQLKVNHLNSLSCWSISSQGWPRLLLFFTHEV